METQRTNWLLAVIAALLGVAVAVGIALVGGLVFEPTTATTAVVLPMLGIFGLVALISAVGVLTLVLRALGLTNRVYALGLPQGTVRALIALSLLVIFLITAVFVYGDLAKPELRTHPGMSADELKQFPDQGRIVEIRSRTEDGELVFDVVVVVPKSKASEDFAKQLLTTISTLLVAMVGFYFGSRTVAAGRSPIEEPSLRILSPESPHKMPKDDRTPLRIKLEAKPNGEAVVWDAPSGDAAGRLAQVEPSVFEYTRGPDPAQIADKVVLRFRLARYPDATVELKVTST